MLLLSHQNQTWKGATPPTADKGKEHQQNPLASYLLFVIISFPFLKTSDFLQVINNSIIIFTFTDEMLCFKEIQ